MKRLRMRQGGLALSTRRVALLIGLALAIALLLGLRLPFLRCEPLIPGTPLLFDEKDYFRGANAIAAGDTLNDTVEAWIRAPGTAWLLLTVARLHGLPVELAGCDYQRVQAGMWAMLLLLIASIAAMLFDRRSALVTALLVAVLPIGAAVSLMVHADTPFMLTQVAAVWALVVYARRGRATWLVVAGVCAGLAALVRSPILPLLPAFALWAGLESWRRARAGAPTGAALRAAAADLLRDLRATPARTLARLALPGALLLACTALVLAPWTIRNYRLYGGFIPSDTTGAVNLLDNNAPRGYPAFRAIRNSSDNPVERQRFATRQALAFIGANPADFARKVAYASWLAWSPETFRRTWNFWNALVEQPRAGALFAQLTVLLWPGIALALLGLLFAPTTADGARGYRALMIVLVLYYTATIGVTHFEERYRLPFLLFWLPYAGWCLAHPHALFARLRRPAGLAAVAVAVALAVSYAPMVWQLQRDNARALALHARGLLRARGGDVAGALADHGADRGARRRRVAAGARGRPGRRRADAARRAD